MKALGSPGVSRIAAARACFALCSAIRRTAGRAPEAMAERPEFGANAPEFGRNAVKSGRFAGQFRGEMPIPPRINTTEADPPGSMEVEAAGHENAQLAGTGEY